MPGGVIDLGTTSEINLEVLASIKPALILTTPYLAPLKPQLEAISPVLELTIYAEGGEALPRSIEATRQLADAIGRRQQAEEFLARSEQFFDDCANRVKSSTLHHWRSSILSTRAMPASIAALASTRTP